MNIRTSILTSLCAASLFSLAASAFGDAIFQKDFTAPAESPQSDLSGMLVWTGSPVHSWGDITVEALPAGVADSPKKALTVFTNSTNPAAPDGSRFCPSIDIKTPGLGADAKTKTVVYLFRYLVPIDGKYRTDFHFGGSWNSNAAILVLASGKVTAMANSTPVAVGEYTPKVWQELRVEFDCAGKTYSIFLDGNKAANAMPWNNPNLPSIDYIKIVAGAMPVDAKTPVFYLEKIDISGK